MTRLSRRTALLRLLGAAVAAPLGLHGLAQVGRATYAQAAPPLVEPTEPTATEAAEIEAAPLASGLVEPGHYFYTLAGPGPDGPLPVGSTENAYGTEIGYSAFEDSTYVVQHHYDPHLNRQEWLGRRIGDFSIADGALMVDALADQSPEGCWALEMRHQAYKDHRYIRATWLQVDPPTGLVAIGTDGLWGEMDNVARNIVPDVRPMGEWNRVLFIASGTHFEGWVNGVKAVEGDDDSFGRGRISLIAMRMSRQPFQTRFRDLHVWDGVLPDPSTVWG